MPTRPPHTPGPGGARRPGALALVRATADVLPLLDAVALAPYEQDRAARLAPGQQRDDYLAAHVLVRVCAARLSAWTRPSWSSASAAPGAAARTTAGRSCAACPASA